MASWPRSAGGAALIRLTGNADPHAFDGIDAERVAAVPLEYAVASATLLLGGRRAVEHRRRAEPRLGDPDLRRARPRAPLGRGAGGDAPRRARPGRGLAAAAPRRWPARAGAGRAATPTLSASAARAPTLPSGCIEPGLWISGTLTHARPGSSSCRTCRPRRSSPAPTAAAPTASLRLTRPLVMPRAGMLVEGLELRFADGRIVDARADRGGDAVVAELDTDEGARSLGEVALVDSGSRIREAGVVFHNTLYDENAGCHVAWGQSFADGDRGRDVPRRRRAVRARAQPLEPCTPTSWPAVRASSVDGVTRDGRTVTIIDDDRWVLPVSRRLRSGRPNAGRDARSAAPSALVALAAAARGLVQPGECPQLLVPAPAIFLILAAVASDLVPVARPPAHPRRPAARHGRADRHPVRRRHAHRLAPVPRRRAGRGLDRRGRHGRHRRRAGRAGALLFGFGWHSALLLGHRAGPDRPRRGVLRARATARSAAAPARSSRASPAPTTRSASP